MSKRGERELLRQAGKGEYIYRHFYSSLIKHIQSSCDELVGEGALAIGLVLEAT